jgi:hypothetical protein
LKKSGLVRKRKKENQQNRKKKKSEKATLKSREPHISIFIPYLERKKQRR